MSRSRRLFFPALFAASLLLLVDTIRSGFLVDRSLLPRFFLLAVVLLPAVIALPRRELVKHDGFRLALFLLFCWSLCSAAWSVAPSEAVMQSMMTFLCMALFLVVSYLAAAKPAFEGIFIRLQIAALLLSFILASWKISSLAYFDPYRVLSVSANNNLYAGFLLLSVPFLLTGYARFSGTWKWISLLALSGTVFMMVILQSRAAYLGLFAGMVIAAILLAARFRTVFTLRNGKAGLVAFILICSGVTVFYLSLDDVRQNYFMSKVPVWNYFRSYTTPGVDALLKKRNAGMADHSNLAQFDFSESYHENANLRAIFWKKSFSLVKQHPVAGVGAGNWRLAVPSCREPANPEHTLRNYTYSQPHNEWIGILSELGIIGFLLAGIVFFLPPGRALWRIIRRKQPADLPALFYSAFLAGFYLYACFDFPMRRIEHSVLLFAALGFLLNHCPWPVCASGSSDNGMKSRFWVAFLRIILVAGVVFTLLVAGFRTRGEYYTVNVFRNEYKDDEAVIRNARLAENPFYLVTPNTLPIAWFEGVARYRLGLAEPARDCFLRALRVTPWEVRVLNDYAVSLYSLRRTDEARKVLGKTLDIDPFFEDARFNLAAILFYQGKTDSARLVLRPCRDSRKKMDFLEELKRK